MAAAKIPWLGDLWLSELFLKAPARVRARHTETHVLARADAGWLATSEHHLRSFRWGQGPQVLLVHGHGGAASQLTSFVDPLLAAGYSVLAYDAPGHGQSPGRHASLPSMGRALRDVLAQVGAVHAVITHSLGGAALCLAAQLGAQVERAVLIAPPSDVRHWYQRFVSGLQLDPAQAQRVRREIERRLSTPMRDLQADRLGPHLHASTLVIHDRDDKEVSLESGAHVARSIAGAQLVTTEGLGHRRILQDPQVIAMAIAFASRGQRPADSLERLIDQELFDRELRVHPAFA